MKKPADVSRWLLVLALAAVTTSSALGSTVTGPACVPGTFTAYENLTGGCNSGLLQLLNFNLFFVDAQGVETLAPTSFTNTISVEPVFRGGTLTLTIGGFTQYQVGAGQTQAYEIDFSSDPPPIEGGMSVELDPPFGHIVGSTFYCGDFVPVSFLAADLAVGESGCGQQGTLGFTESNGASVTFNPPLFSLDLSTLIRLNPNNTSGGVASGFDGVVFTIQTVAQTPEPATWALTVFGLGLAAYRRRMSRG